MKLAVVGGGSTYTPELVDGLGRLGDQLDVGEVVLMDTAPDRLYLVGGSVRDALLGREQSDLDFTTDARPPAVLALLEGWADAVWDTGIAFGTVGARRRGVTV